MIKKWLICSFLFTLVLGTILPSFTTISTINFNLSTRETNNQQLAYDIDLEPYKEPSIPLKIDVPAESNPEAYFPNFLFYSVEIANALIDYLYDNVSGGFYVAADEHWSESSINRDKKRTYDNAQAILALLKLSDAVFNLTERDFAIDIAEKTGNYLITNLYDETNDGFLTSELSQYKQPGIQAKAIQALLSLYEITGNLTYRDIAIDAFDFLDEYAWDNKNGNFIYLLSNSGLIASSNPDPYDPYDPESKRVDHNILMGNALLDLYRLESDEKYLTNAQRIYDFFNTTCRNTSTGLFYTGLNSNSEIAENDSADIFINSLVLEFQAQLYNVTQDSKYYDDFFTLINAILSHFWDNEFGGFYATYSYLDFEERDTKKYTERQFYVIRALDEAYKLTNNSLYYNLIFDIIEFLNEKLYDNDHAGYYQLVNADGWSGDPNWKNKYTVTQSLAIYSLANLWMYSKPGVLNAVWVPSTPLANEDPVTILVAAFDSNGLSNVLFNYSINDDPYQIVEMAPYPLIGNMFNYTLDSHPDDTRVNFNIIVNDTLGNQVIRGSYFFFWQVDEWPPEILEIGIDPGNEIPIDTAFSITLVVQDVPVQGDVDFVRMYYHLSEESEESIALDRIDIHFWKVTFSEGFPTPGTFAYKFEAIDNRGNFVYSSTDFFYILGHLDTGQFPASFLIGVLFIMFIFVPAGLYTYVEYKKKSARTTLKNIRKTQGTKRKKKRGTRRKM